MSALIYQVGIGGIGGFIAGYAFKKLLKIVAIVIGFFIIVLIYLGYQGIITINFGELENSIANALGMAGQATGFIATIIAFLPAAGSFGAGFFLGFKIG
jgi:uncharacterized membrane protein (Fun14 family)